MKHFLHLFALVVGLSSTSFAITVSCTVTSGTVLTSTLGGLGYSIANGIGTSTGGATGVISCPAVSTGIGFLQNYQVLATVDYQGGPFGTTSGTSVSQILRIVGGSLNGSSVTGVISGGNSSSGVVPPVPFQIGSTLSGATSYAAFTVTVQSTVTAGGPVGGSSGQVVLSYEVAAPPPQNPIPEPSTYALISAGLAGLGIWRRRQVRR
jgi:hypothetical protein